MCSRPQRARAALQRARPGCALLSLALLALPLSLARAPRMHTLSLLQVASMETSLGGSLLCLLRLAASLLCSHASLPRFVACYVCSVLDVACVGGRCRWWHLCGWLGWRWHVCLPRLLACVGGMCAWLACLITHPISLPRTGHLLT